MAITNPSLKPFVINNTDIQFLLDQVNFVPLFDSLGNAIINWDGTGSVYDAYHNLLWNGTTGSYKGVPLTVANYLGVLGTSYQNTTDLSGLRDPSGFNNNLTLIHAHWGQANYDFPRTTPADFTKYSQEVIAAADGAFTVLAPVTTTGTSSTTNSVILSNSGGPNSTTVGGVTVAKTTAEEIGLATVVSADTTVNKSVKDGHHTSVTLTDTSIDKTTTTSTYVYDTVTTSTTISQGANTATSTAVNTTKTAPVQQGPAVTVSGPVTETLSGGELDTTTMIRLADGLMHRAHTFRGVINATNDPLQATKGDITNGVTTAADYHNPWDSVVDYTPRMISRATTTAGVTYDTWANHQADAGASSHMPNEIYYDPTTGVANVLDWGQLKTIADGGLGQVDTQARFAASAGQDDHFIGGQNPGVQGSNGFFVLFGQFFDHGLDFVDKGAQGSVIKIALAVDDPLYGMLGPDGQPVTSITINRATVDGALGADGTPQYVNHASPFIDQSQTYGSSSQVTNLLREWVKDPVTGKEHAGMKMLDGHTLATTWVNGHGQTVNDTLPTLNELRAHIQATGRTDLTWEDISNLRNRDADGHVIAGNSGSALILDSNPRFDADHLFKGNASEQNVVNTALGTLEADVKATFGATASFGVEPSTHKLTLTYYTPNPTLGGPAIAHVLTGASALYPWVDFSNFGIMANHPNTIGGSGISDAVHAAVGEVLMASVGDHYIAGDGRVNENFGLTSIHHVFHEEHNFQVQNLMEALHTQDIATNDVAHVKLHEFQVDTGHGMNADGDYIAVDGSISWDMDKMFNASKLIVEMEYQHAAVDQYARNVTPNIQEFVGYSPDKNPGVTLEYAQGAFRFGHSTLRETIDTIDPNHGLTGKIMGYALRDAFLNPDQYAKTGAAAILNGMTHQQMNEVDEFVTPALNQGLLGQPLDLAAINIARGRDIGLPTLNDFRAAIGLLKYTSWTDFGQNMQHPQSLANFIAAYSLDGDTEKAQALVDLASGAFNAKYPAGATAAEKAVIDTANLAAGLADAAKAGYAHATAADLTAAISAATTFINTDQGFNHIDTWLGGLAEIHQPGGILGETFDKVFVNQIESLMDGDRFYYLYRLAGQQFSEEVGNGQLKDIVERNTGLTHLNGNVFGYSDQYIDLGAKKEVAATGIELQTTSNEHKYGDVYATTHNTDGSVNFEGTFVSAGALSTHAGLGVYTNGGLGNANDGQVINIDGVDYIQDTRLADTDPNSAYAKNGGVNIDGSPNSGAESHEVIVGTANADLIYGQGGDDTVYGEGGNDIIYGGFGIDRLYGGTGNDTIYGGDNPDLIDGGSGDDKLYGDSSGSDINGADQIIGGSGNDYIDGGIGIDKLSGGTGDDHVIGGQDTDPFTHGSDGNDWVEGNSGGDILYGDNGDDLLEGGADQDQLFGGSGDDILRPGDPTGALTIGTDEVLGNDGTDVNDTGFDLVDFSDNTLRPGGVNFDLGNQANPSVTTNGTPTQIGSFQIDGIVGSVGNDTLSGDGTDAAGAGADISIAGHNWLVGGGGSDTLTGGGGNDIIVGGSIRLDALIGKYNTTYDHNNGNNGLTQADIQQDARYQGASHRVLYSETIDNTGLIDAANAAAGGALFDKHFTEMLRSDQFKNIVLGDGGASAGDTAVFSGTSLDYSFTTVAAAGLTGVKTVGLTGAGVADGTDLVIGVDNLKFALETKSIAENTLAVGAVVSTGAGAITYTLTGADAALFDVVGGQLVFKVPPNFEVPTDAGANNVYDVTVAAKDANGVAIVQDFAVTVTDVNEPPTFTTGLAFTINENTTTVTTVAAVDPEGTAIVYGLAGPNAALFTINAATGALAFVSPAAAVNPSSVYGVTVTASDGVNTTSQALTITVNNVNQPPVISTIALSVAENTQAVGTVVATDADADPLTYTIAGGVDASLFSIDATTGALSFNSAAGANFESTTHTPDYHINVSVSDGISPAVVQALTINVTNVNEAATGVPVISDVTPTAGQALSLNLTGIVDPDGPLTAISYQWQSSTNGTTWTNIASPAGTASTFTPTDTAGSGVDPFNGLQLRAVVSYTAGGLAGSVTSAATGPTGENWTSTSLVGGTHTGTTGDDLITGGFGADTLSGGAGDDVITYNVATLPILGLVSGRDIIDGGANGTAAGDRYILNGQAGVAETFRIYTATAWQALGAATHTISAGTDIVITRNGTANNNVISELRNIEEITVNGSAITVPVIPGTAGGDTIQLIGNFNGTSLNFNTVTVNGGAQSDTVDISQLTSAHRIVFNSGGGTDSVIGTVRPQDVVNYGVTVSTDPATTGTVHIMPAGGPDTFPSPPEDHDDNASGPTTPPVVPTAAPAIVDQNLIGDGSANVLAAGDGNNTIAGLAGDDLIVAGNGNNKVVAGEGSDTVVLGNGNNHVDAGLGADNVFLGNGTNWVAAGNGDDTVFGGTGNTTFVDNGNDGNDTYHGGGVSDTLDMSAISANIQANLGTGYAGWAKVGTEVNHLYGIENIATGMGDDTVTASEAHNMIDVGDHSATGHDTVIFRSAAAADGDTIANFQAGDKIDLSNIMSGTINLVTNATNAHDIAVQFDATTHGDSIVTGIDEAGNHFTIDVKGHHVVGTDFAA